MTKEKKFMTVDGNNAAAYTSYAFTEVAGIYPITPSSPMADYIDQWSVEGKKNLFGQTVKVCEMQSEAGAAGTVHGSLAAGALTTTYTASQGLLLMIPNMYKIAGELLPGVFHVTARCVASHALNIFGDHSDVMACRQTGFALLASNSVQEAMDLAAVAHLCAIKGRIPFLHFFDGFRTSHEIQKIEALDYEDLNNLIDFGAVQEFRDRALNPNNPVIRGTAQNPDIFFQAREACNPYYDALPDIVEYYMGKISELTGRNYKPFNYYGSPDAEKIIIAMGSVCETIEETIDHLIAKGEKVGLVKVHLYRPFSMERLLEAVPSTVRKIAVLDRTKEPGAQGEPLFLDVCTAFYNKGIMPVIVNGRYGLGSKEVYPNQIVAVYKNLDEEKPVRGFTIGIEDDVTNLSLKTGEFLDTVPAGTKSCLFWGLGADGTVGANKNSIKIIGDHTNKYAQAYFAYDSKKSGGITVSHLRFGDQPIKSTYLIKSADFLACHNPSYVNKYDMLSDLKKDGTFLLNCAWDAKMLDEKLPAAMKRYIAKNNIAFYTIDAVHLAKEIGLGGRINTIMQSAFFKLAEIIPADDAITYMKKAAYKSYGSKGDAIVNMNYAAIDAGVNNVKKVEVPSSWADAVDEAVTLKSRPDFIKNVVEVMNAQKGDSLPVSSFSGREDGTFPQGTSKYEKRGIAVDVPEWLPDNCIQCNQCSYVCPHAVIRPFLLTDKEKGDAPASFITKKGMKPYDDKEFRIQLSLMDCTGCGSCASVCPSKVKALVMKPFDTQIEQAANWEYATEKVSVKPNPMTKSSVKGSQFETPYFEFSGACAGCGETPYAKLITQLFGDRMIISNATGCSSIWGASAPSMPYTADKNGHGPAWANSLFEDNAEHGLGIHLANKQIREGLAGLMQKAIDLGACEEVKAAFAAWLEAKEDSEKTREASDKVIAAISSCTCGNDELKKTVDKIFANKDYLVKRSTWIFGGDGWAYDIGYGGLDHVLATGENVNVCVFDTEVYSNTGGQASKSTQLGAIAEFAAGGKPIKKKDLGMMAMSYGYVYVAQVAMGANQAQTLKAFAEAEAYQGPSIVICYSPCINHGMSGGLTISQAQEKRAVDSGYWHLYRYNPLNRQEGKNPFIMDSKEPTAPLRDFLMSEVRYSSLTRKFPAEKVDMIVENAKHAADERYDSYKRMAANLDE
ncbi:MAG: pyruvate:ferredoxin (flavodoxin) oxidoreductase [Saccharofermentanales bacterium]